MSVAVQTRSKVSFKKLLWVGPLAIAAAIAANLIIRGLAVAVGLPSPGFTPLASPGPVIFFSLIGMAGAVLAFAALGRFTAQPVRIFQIVAGVVLVISFLPDLALLGAGAPFPGATLPAVATLMVMHVTAAAIAVGLLTRLAVEA